MNIFHYLTQFSSFAILIFISHNISNTFKWPHEFEIFKYFFFYCLFNLTEQYVYNVFLKLHVNWSKNLHEKTFENRNNQATTAKVSGSTIVQLLIYCLPVSVTCFYHFVKLIYYFSSNALVQFYLKNICICLNRSNFSIRNT